MTYHPEAEQAVAAFFHMVRGQHKHPSPGADSVAEAILKRAYRDGHCPWAALSPASQDEIRSEDAAAAVQREIARDCRARWQRFQQTGRY